MRRGLLHTALAVTLATAASAALVGRAADRRLAAMHEWAAAAEAAWAARDFDRLPLLGEAQAGSAFAHYQQATDLIAALDARTTAQARDLRLHPDGMPPAAAAALRQQYAPALQQLQLGAHCRDSRPPVHWRDGFGHRVQNLLQARELVNAAVLTGRALRADGAPAAAVQLLLDAATFGSDLLGSPILIDQMIGAALTLIATTEAFDADALDQLPPAALGSLQSGLERLDARLPLLVDFTGEALLFANTLEHAPAQLDQCGPSLRSWRYGFSTRLAAAEAVLFEVQLTEELAAAAARPFAEREQLLAQMLARPPVQQNPVLAVALPNLTSAERTLRETATLVRLLRCDVACRLGQPSPSLPDPLGTGPLRRQDDGSVVCFVSAGQRGGKPIERRTPRS